MILDYAVGRLRKTQSSVIRSFRGVHLTAGRLAVDSFSPERRDEYNCVRKKVKRLDDCDKHSVRFGMFMIQFRVRSTLENIGFVWSECVCICVCLFSNANIFIFIFYSKLIISKIYVFAMGIWTLFKLPQRNST